MKKLLAGLVLATTAALGWAQSLPSPSYNAVKANSVQSNGNVQAYGTVQGSTLATNQAGYPGTPGSSWQSQYHANWNVVQSQVQYNPTEWQVYPNAANGIAQTQSGTNQLVLQSGSAFNTSWAGLPYLYFNGVQYKVASVTDSSHLTVQTTSGGTVSFPSTTNGTYYFVTTSTTSVVNVNGTAVTYVSGQPFVGLYQQVFINGTAYTATYNSPTSMTLGTSAGTLNNATLEQYNNINNELSVLRLQGLNGANEENFAITERPDGTYLQSLYAGQGQYRPIFFTAGETPAGTMTPMMVMYPNATLGNAGFVALGGNGTNMALAVNQNANNVNHLLVQGSATGATPSIAARGSDTNVGVGIDVQGANNTTFTSHSFGNTEFQVFGVGGTSWLAAGSSTSDAPTLSANGADANIGVNIFNKGTGQMTVNGGGISTTAITASGNVAAANIITANKTVTMCASGCTFSSILDFNTYVNTLTILGNYTVTLNISAGTYPATGSYPISFLMQGGNWSHVQILGAAAATTILNFNNLNNNNAPAFFAQYGAHLNFINHVTINGVGGMTGTHTWADPGSAGAAFSVQGHASVHAGADVVMNNYYYDVLADVGGYFLGDAGVTGNHAGDVNFLARHGGVIHCEGCFANDAGDASMGLGCNFLAENDGVVWADSSTATAGLIGGFCASAGGAAWYHNVTVSGSSGPGLYSFLGGIMFVDGSTSTSNNMGMMAATSGRIMGSNVTVSGNTQHGVMLDHGYFEGTAITSKNNGKYGFYVIDGSWGRFFSTASLSTGNTSGLSWVDIGSACTSTSSTNCDVASSIVVN